MWGLLLIHFVILRLLRRLLCLLLLLKELDKVLSLVENGLQFSMQAESPRYRISHLTQYTFFRDFLFQPFEQQSSQKERIKCFVGDT